MERLVDSSCSSSFSPDRTGVAGRQEAAVAVRRMLRLQRGPMPAAAYAAAAHRLQRAAAVPAKLAAAACRTVHSAQ